MGSTLFDRTISGTAGIHHTSAESLEDTIDYSVWRIEMEGDYEKLKSLRDSAYKVGDNVNTVGNWMDYSGSGSIVGDKVVIGVSLSRKDANIGSLVSTIKNFYRGYTAVMDFEVVPTDIHLWRIRAKDNVPELNHVQNWERMKQEGTALSYSLYDKFCYTDAKGNTVDIKKEVDDGKTPKATLVLCQMIKRGVEQFNVYVPTLQITWTLGFFPEFLSSEYHVGEMLGRVIKNADDIFIKGNGFNVAKASRGQTTSPVTSFIKSTLGNYIVCTGDNCVGNSDGSYTVTRSFTKAFDVEGNLFLNQDGEPVGEIGPWLPKWDGK